MMHNKLLVVRPGLPTTSVGSTNFDVRSFRLNDEASLNVYDAAFAARMTEVFEADLKPTCAGPPTPCGSSARWKEKLFEKFRTAAQIRAVARHGGLPPRRRKPASDAPGFVGEHADRHPALAAQDLAELVAARSSRIRRRPCGCGRNRPPPRPGPGAPARRSRRSPRGPRHQRSDRRPARAISPRHPPHRDRHVDQVDAHRTWARR